MRAIAALAGLVLFGASPGRAQQRLTSGGKLRPEQAIMDIRHYDIALRVDIPQKSIAGSTTIDLVLSQATPVLLFDLLDSFQVHSVTVDGKAEPYLYANNLITITGHQPFQPGRISVTVAYEGKPHVALNPPWGDGFTWTRDSSGNPWVAITAEGIGGKLYFPCKDHPSDEPNEGADMLITVPKGLVVAGPGLLQSVKSRKGWDTYHWKTRYTINNYSIVFNIGKYVVVKRTYTTIAGHQVPIEFYVLAEHAAKAERHLDVFERTIHEQEKYFGEYPWVNEKIGLVETPHLGMEHQTMNAYGNKFRYTKVGGQDYDPLMHHEFGHEWWGNKMTANDWADYWIHEGINTFGDALYILDLEGERAYIDYFKKSVFQIHNRIPVVQGKDIDEETAYQSDIYPKGAFFMHTLRYVLGDSLFFPTLKQLITDTAYTYNHLVDTHDIEQYFSKAAGIDLSSLFHLYLYTVDKLEVTVHERGPNTYSIQIDNLPMTLPIDVQTDDRTHRYQVGSKPMVFYSSTMPVIDPDGYYLKKVTYDD